MHGWLKTAVQRVSRITGLQHINGPDAQWIAEAACAHPLTPDVWVLGQFEYQLVFVYGTQMRGHPQHQLMSAAGAYAATTYTDDRFNLWKKRLGHESYPIALENSGWSIPDWNRPPRERVQGELYAIPTHLLFKLDEHYQNTLEFKRKRVPLVLPYKHLYEIVGGTPIQQKINESLGIPQSTATISTETLVYQVRAWMYIGKSDYWDNQLSHHFAPVSAFHSRVGWLGDYVAFTKEEYVK